MHLIIDGSNIKEEGGGLIHLIKLVDFYKNQNNTTLTIISSKKTLNKLKDHKFLIKKHINSFVENNIFLRLIWQKFYINKKNFKNYDLLITLGGISFSNFKPAIVLCQNLLPFSKDQYYKYSIINKIKLFVQSRLYLISFNNAQGVIYMTKASKEIIEKNGFNISTNYEIIHHGKKQSDQNLRKYNNFNKLNSFKLLYVSRYQPYKNHIKLIECFDELTKLEFNLNLTLIFPESYKSFSKIKKILFNKTKNKKIILKNDLNNFELSKEYKKADCLVYPSECETFGIPLVEAASFSLPIACTNYSVFKEILDNTGDYFDINDKESIKRTIIKLYENIDYLRHKSSLILKKSKVYSWNNCMNKYHNYIVKIITNEKK